MKTLLIVIATLSCSYLFSQSKFQDAKAFQDNMNQEYADSLDSPLKPLDRKIFSELPFYPIDTDWVISAAIERIIDEDAFEMETTTDRLPLYSPYYRATFSIDSIPVSLTIYQSEDLKTREGYENYLFLPFTDATNGSETYGGGRYIDLKISEGDSLTIDFNRAYNPYCAYNKKYSCPIPPRENDINIPIKAGVKYVAKD
jgi:hypothetical protein